MFTFNNILIIYFLDITPVMDIPNIKGKPNVGHSVNIPQDQTLIVT